jgi:hypothetical protein
MTQQVLAGKNRSDFWRGEQTQSAMQSVTQNFSAAHTML